MVDLAVLGISLQEEDGAPMLLLHPRGTRQALCLRIGPMEAFAISSALHTPARAAREGGTAAVRDLFPRPQTHDLLLNTIQALNGVVTSVDILHLVDGAFIAEAVIDHPGGRARVDCRPSDGIALALRCGAAIRATSAVAAHAEDIDAVMATLPEYVRALAAAKLATLPEKPETGSLARLPLAIEAALKARSRDINRDAQRNLISAARKMLAEESAGTGAFSGQNAPPEAEAGAKRLAGLPQIRVSLVRHKSGGEAEIVDEFQIPSSGLPKEVIASLGLTGREAEAVNSASDEERWAMLLRMLSPETKVLM